MSVMVKQSQDTPQTYEKSTELGRPSEYTIPVCTLADMNWTISGSTAGLNPDTTSTDIKGTEVEREG